MKKEENEVIEVKKEIKEEKKEKVKMFEITFKENRTYEMYIGNNFYRFSPRGQEGCSHVVAEAIIKNPNFESKQKRFIIKEVK